MSATMNAQHFAEFFRHDAATDAPILYVEGRTYPVSVKYLPATIDDGDYVHKALVTIFQLHRQLPPESVQMITPCDYLTSEHFLVFLTGQEEIEAVKAKMRTVGWCQVRK